MIPSPIRLKKRVHQPQVYISSQKPTCKGFTLLELLVVLMIMGVIFGSITYSLNTTEDTELMAQRFASLVDLALDEAVLKSQEYAVQFDDYGYYFFRLEQNGWQKVEEEIFRPRNFPAEITLELLLDGDLVDAPQGLGQEDELIEYDDQRPTIFLLSSGEMTPFKASFKDRFSHGHYLVTGDQIAGIVMSAGVSD